MEIMRKIKEQGAALWIILVVWTQNKNGRISIESFHVKNTAED